MPPPTRPLAVFALSFAVLAAIAGDTLLRPSQNNHYIHMAAAWLDGRLEHAGRPPGYPRADDWGKVTTLHLADGRTIRRAHPCKTAACAERRRSERVELWWSEERELLALPRGAIVGREERWYVTFPPGPALVFLPGVALLGLTFPDVLATALLAAMIPALLVAHLDRIRGRSDGRGREHLWIAAAWALGSPALFVGAHGSVWFSAQIVGALALTLHLIAGWDARRPLLAGLALGVAVACRPTTLLALPFFALEWWREGRGWRRLVAFAAPLALIGAALAIFNEARFGDPLEFGHRYLEMRWQERVQTHGAFSPVYLRRNLECMLFLWPQVQASAPFLRWSIHGMGLLLASPWLVCLGLARDRFPQRRGLALAAIAAAIPPLLYHNSGQLQLGYRFALDWLPMVVLLIAFGGGARRRIFPPLVIVAAIVGLVGAWYFHRAPGRIFVHDLWWPLPPE
ncbi:MAG: hypothetical protein H6711_02360 [Myxococcales bacterium]|nr:hypothetical protein [Myxococcales bacterium]